MKKCNSVFSAAALAIALLCGVVPAHATIMVTFTPTASHINVGDVTTVDVSISGLGSEVLSAFDMNVVWDPSVLRWAIADFSPGCNQLGTSTCTFNSLAQGNVGMVGTSLETDADLAVAQPDDFLLATILLEGVANGATIFTLGPDFTTDRAFIGLRAQSLSVDVGSVCISVGTGVCSASSVPEPATLALMALSAAGLGFARRRVALPLP